MKKILLVDVSSLFFRAYYALPPMYNKKGAPTNALYGLCNTSLNFLNQKDIKHLVYCFDRKEPSFRAELYSEYKQNRDEIPDELGAQIPYIKKLVDALGIPRLEKKGFEADDIIGTLATKYSKKGYQISIISGDKDFVQLINPQVSMYDPMRKIHFDAKHVKTKWGIKPPQMIDYLALMGDASDNIPGVSGVGAKTAQTLLTDYKDLDHIYKNLQKIKESTRKKLEEGKDDAYLSHELVTIDTKVELGEKVQDLEIKGFQKELEGLLEEFNFKKFKEKLFKSKTVEKEEPSSKGSSQKTDSKKTLTSKQSKNFELLNFKDQDFKESLSAYSNILAFEWEDKIYYNIEKNKVISFDGNFKKIQAALNEKRITWSGFDLKSLWHKIDIEEPVASQDFMLMSYVLTSQNVKLFAQVYEKYTDKTCDVTSLESVYKSHLELEKILVKKLKEASQKKVLEELELPLIPALYRMEKEGISIDEIEFKNLEKKTEIEITELEKKIHKQSGEKFNISSPKQLSEVLFDKMKLPALKKTKTGISTNNEVLQKLSLDHPICKDLIQFRELTKLQSTYIKALPALLNPETHKIHTCFKQAVTSTGRLSSVHPNLQNIPIRTERGKKIRQAFVASSKSKVFISLDYSQIELRILAHIAQDKNLCEAFHKDLDIHSMTASEIFSVNLSQVTEEQRRRAKAVNFGIAYGQGAYGLAEQLGISRGEGKVIIETYFKKFPSIKKYIAKTIEQAHKLGYVETLFERRRYLPELKSSNPAIQKFAERAAINAPMQGTASDLIKKAMIIVDGELQAPMILQVHDELLLECPRTQAKKIAAEAQEIMESVIELSVPLKVNISIGDNWKEAH